VGLAEAYSSHVVGLDNSAKMLAEVRSSDDRVSYCLGDARALPLRGGSVGMVFLSNVVHHLADLPKAAGGFAHVLSRAASWS
jgi:ubiquinone/menaquinone biosynthesis C-methylase UbiE